MQNLNATQSANPSDDLISKVTTLPPLPAVALQIIDRLGDEFVDGNEIADVVAQDPAIAGRLIGLANSAFFALPRPVTNMRDVVNRVLGADSVRTLAFALATQQAFDTSRCSAFDTEQFWMQSLRAATYCKRLTAVLPEPDPLMREHAFVVGLCHALGMLVIAFLEPGQLNDLLEGIDTFDTDLIDQGIRAHYGMSVMALTAALARHWKLPEPIIDTYLNCARQRDASEQAAIVLTAAIATSRLDIAGIDPEYRAQSRKDLVHRCATALAMDDTAVEVALELPEQEAVKLSRNAAAMSSS